MVIKGASRRSITFWSRHLSDTKQNDRAEIVENRGLAGNSLRDMMREMQQDAKITRAQNFMYVASFNPCAHERLTEEQWDRAFEIFEKHRGILPGQQRIVIEHEKNGRTHRHVVWNRIDTERMRAFPDSHDLKVCDAAEKEIERELGLERTPHFYDRDPNSPRLDRGPKSWEMYRGQRSQIDPRDVTTEVTALFRESANAADFVEALRQHGYEMVKGNRALCILDPAGDVHSLARRIEGVNTKELKAYMKGLDLSSLPSLEQAKTQYQQRKIAGLEADRATVQHEIAWEERLAEAAIAKEKIERQFVEPGRDQPARAGGREGGVRSPFEPPRASGTSCPEFNKTSPELSFEDAACEATEPAPPPEPPDHLKGTAREIWNAWHHSDSPRAFAAALNEHGVALAAVTKEEADRSHRQAEFATAVGNWAPRYREGEIVAVSPQGHIYKLNERATGESAGRVQEFLSRLPEPLESVTHTGENQQQKEERRRRVNTYPDPWIGGPQSGHMVEHQAWALDQIIEQAKRRRDDEERQRAQQREQPTAERQAAVEEIDPQRLRTDPSYRNEVRQRQAQNPHLKEREERDRPIREHQSDTGRDR